MSLSISPDPIAILLLSGGLDSMTVGAMAREQGFRLFALTIDYNQRHRVELEAAGRVAEAIGAERHIVLPIDLSRFGGSALTDDIAVPKEGVGEGIPITYVPARNAIFLSLCLGWAEAAGARDIFIGVNALDYSGYPDCRPDFIAAFEEMARRATKAGAEGGAFRIRTPLMHLTKAEIVQEARRLGLDLGLSWSCYDPAHFPAIAACAIPAACAPKASPRRAFPTPPITPRPRHELCGQGDFPDSSGRRDAGGTARGLPALFRLQFVDGA